MFVMYYNFPYVSLSLLNVSFCSSSHLHSLVCFGLTLFFVAVDGRISVNGLVTFEKSEKTHVIITKGCKGSQFIFIGECWSVIYSFFFVGISF